jgi:pyrroline-5-carboxylate reductase
MTVLLVGCGRMGGALARSWTSTRRVLAFDRNAVLPDGVERLKNLADVAESDELVVVLAVKPQAFGEVVPLLAPLLARDPLIVSIIAGLTIGRLAASLGGHQRIVRSMPNTPAAVGRGITASVWGKGVGSADKGVVDRLFLATGEHLWLNAEGDLDLVTAVSGSGPAYFFRMAEALAQAGAACGLPPNVAMRLACATFTGAAALAEADTMPLARLREQVTSPGGTTAAGLTRMNAGGAIDLLMEEVVTAAAERSRALSG